MVGDEALLRHVTVYAGTGLAATYNCRGWWRPAEHWAKRMEAGKPKARPPHLTRAVADPKYRTRLCTHWEASAKGDDGSGNGLGPGGVPACPMRKKGKCDFAHGPGKQGEDGADGRATATDVGLTASLHRRGGRGSGVASEGDSSGSVGQQRQRCGGTGRRGGGAAAVRRRGPARTGQGGREA